MIDARAVVTSLNRADRLANVAIDDPAGTATEVTYLGEAPWPLSTAALAGDLSYLCLGPIGDRRRVVREDFLATSNATTLTATTLISDAAWAVSLTGTASIDNTNLVNAGDLTAAGMRRLVAPASSTARIRLNDQSMQIPDQDTAVWLSGRLSIGAGLFGHASAFARFGLANTNVADNGAAAATDVGVYVNFGTNVLFDTVRGTSFTESTGPALEAALTWYWVDIVFVSGEWAAFWFDGTGPYVHDTNIPTVGDQGLEPFAYISTPSGATAAIGFDVIEAQIVTPVSHPIDYALAVGAPLPDVPKP